MAIAVELSIRGAAATPAKYDEAIRRMDATPGGRHPGEGCLFHWVRVAPDGLHVTDVWDTREHFDRFAAEKIGPISEQVGLPQPQTKFFDVHNFLTAH
jgi:hypothetical protein